MDNPGPLLILHNPPTYIFTQTLHTFISNRQIWSVHIIKVIYVVCFGNLGPFDDAMGGMRASWWRKWKTRPFDNVMGNYRSHWGPLNDAMIYWDPLIAWWELGALDGEMDNLGPFTLKKAMGRKTGNWAPYGAMEHWFQALWWQNGQIRDPSDDEIGAPDDSMGKLGALDHKFFSNG